MERCIHDEFVARMVSFLCRQHSLLITCLAPSPPLHRQVEEVKKMKIGDPLDRSVSHGPQNHKSVKLATCRTSNLSIIISFTMIVFHNNAVTM